MNIRTATILLLLSTSCGLLFYGCKKSNNTNPKTDATSKICSNVKGTEAIYWDLMNGIPRTDLGYVPTISSIGGTYIHPTYPLLTFNYPPGYTATTDPSSGWIGVTLQRNDNKSVWYYSNLFTSTPYTAATVLNAEVANVRSFFGSTGTQVTTVCQQQDTQPRAPGITTTVASAYITFNGFSAVINCMVTNETSLGAEQVSIALSAASTTDFANEILNTYLPIDYQMLYKNDGELDSDGDGYPDSIDAFPFDPTKH